MFERYSNILELDYFHFYNKFVDLGNMFKRHSLRLDRNSERRTEIREQRERELQKVFGKKLGNNGIRIERVHRVKDKKSQSSTAKRRTIALRSYLRKKKKFCIT